LKNDDPEGQIDVGIIAKIRELMNSPSSSLPELYEQLRRYRNLLHPDRFLDDEAKKSAADRFKEVQGLMAELIKRMERDQLERPAAEVAIYQGVNERIQLQTALDVARDEADSLRQESEQQKREIERLQQVIRQFEDQRFKEEADELKASYKPSRMRWASLGLLAGLAGFMTLASRIDEVASVFKRVAPFPEAALNAVVFAAFAAVLATTLGRLWNGRLIEHELNRLRSSKSATEFMEFLSHRYQWSDNRPKVFREKDAVEFVESALRQRYRLWRAPVPRLPYRVFSDSFIIEQLKNCFINSLLSRHLVAISTAAELDRTFIIREARFAWYE